MRHARFVSMLFLSCFSATAFAADAPVKTIASLYQERAKLQGKQVQVRGKVVKVNNGIMQRNFLHVQDGTGTQGSNDLTVTTTQSVNVGDEVVVTGTVAVDKDFGAGYTYPLLLEQASVSARK